MYKISCEKSLFVDDLKLFHTISPLKDTELKLLALSKLSNSKNFSFFNQNVFRNRPNWENKVRYLGNDEPGVFLARLGPLFKENPVSQSDESLPIYRG